VYTFMNCYQAKAGELAKQWYVIDATGVVVGRLAAQIAPILMGKHRPTYTPHIDTGDYVIVTNVEKVVFTGNKWQQKFYQRYTGHPGGQKDERAANLLKRRPDRILHLAVQRMMPKNKIGRHMLAKLKLYVGEGHPHQAQAPIPLEPLSGRPTPSGAVLVPKPKAKDKDKAKAAPSEAPPAPETFTPSEPAPTAPPEPVETPVQAAGPVETPPAETPSVETPPVETPPAAEETPSPEAGTSPGEA
jgi:large subunit ribosomal protein L13